MGDPPTRYIILTALQMSKDGDLPKIHPSLSVLPWKQSLYLTFPEIKLECVDKLVTENLFFYKAENSKKNGFIFKTTDGSSTVTLYKTTFFSAYPRIWQI